MIERSKGEALRFKVFIGFDAVETVAFNVFAHSIWTRSSAPVSVVPVKVTQLPMSRPWHPKQSNEFAFSRWLVPWICDYKGWALFADCDMLALADFVELEQYLDPRYAVRVVKHSHEPPEGEKFLGRPQTRYRRKNWSSFVLFNCDRCRILDPTFVNEADGLYLHQFGWLRDEEIGELPPEWNYLVGWDEGKYAKVAHFTEGGPYFSEYRGCEYTEEWEAAHDEMLACQQRSAG